MLCCAFAAVARNHRLWALGSDVHLSQMSRNPAIPLFIRYMGKVFPFRRLGLAVRIWRYVFYFFGGLAAW